MERYTWSKNDNYPLGVLLIMLRRSSIFSLPSAATLLVAAFLFACQGVSVRNHYSHGAVASTSPIASSVGREIMESGGNAFDAAIAVSFALAVVYPQAGNIGGGGFAVIRDGKSGNISTLDFRETAPLTAFETMFLDSAGDVIEGLSTSGAKSAGVPGSVAGLHGLWKKHGRLSWSELLAPAIKLADTGFLVDSFLVHELIEQKDSLSFFPESKEIFFPTDKALKTGERFVQKDLSATLSAIAAEGPDGFYRGRVAALIDSSMRRHGGVISEEDLARYAPVWREPTHIKFDSLDIYTMAPPSSGGIIIGQILKLIEPFELSGYRPHSSEYIHLFSEACRLAFADRAEHLGDPEFYRVPNGLLDSTYLNSRRKLIIPERAGNSGEISAGRQEVTESEQTTHISVCDSAGNMVALTTTINGSFGSRLVVDGAGFLLNNEMDDFSIKPGHPNIYGLVGGEGNKVEPGKRMLSSMSPTLVLKHGKPFLILGSSGGSKIITTVAQAIIAITRFSMEISDVAKLGRFHHQWVPDKIYLEEKTFDMDTKQTLIRYGHNIEERTRYSDLQIIHIEENGMMTAASDPRNGGQPDGF
ncbi:MAG: gamma-glutamyltransferase [candidate division Zixibacteria bacterium]|nr:gamma-glutamyltransferase [candidate division Zixibacteria bacterium]